MADDTSGAVRGLGEIAFRTESLDAVCDFYKREIRLPVPSRGETSAFFELAEGHGGHAQVLALFDRTAADGYEGISQSTTTSKSPNRSRSADRCRATARSVRCPRDREIGPENREWCATTTRARDRSSRSWRPRG